MVNDASKKTSSPSRKELITLVKDARRLLHYVARHGGLTINSQVAKGIASASANINNENWSVSDELQLIYCYDQLTRQIYPVTIDSIKAVISDTNDKKTSGTSAEKTITYYRYGTVLTLLCLLSMQMFYLFGHTLIQSLATYTNSVSTIVSPLPVDIEANYLLLKQWNHIWMLGQTLQLGELPRVNNLVNKFGIAFSANLIAAQSFLQMLQNYLLPLVYGLLGAFIFVLRSLLQQVRNLTYTASREIGYRLRLTLGCLAGMITGWFLKPEVGDMALSPMALAFLAGYSIEVLFALLDKLINSIRKQTNDVSPSNTSNQSNLKDPRAR